jgi:hypothetical protein
MLHSPMSASCGKPDPLFRTMRQGRITANALPVMLSWQEVFFASKNGQALARLPWKKPLSCLSRPAQLEICDAEREVQAGLAADGKRLK